MTRATFKECVKPLLMPAALAARALAFRLLAAARPRRPIPAAPRRILALRLDRLGDLALSTSTLEALRRRFRPARLDVACLPGPARLLLGHPAVDRILAPRSASPAALAALARRLAAEHYDLAFDLALARPAAPALVARHAAPCVGFAAWGKGPLYDLAVPDPGFSRPFAEAALDLLAPFGARPPAPLPRLHLLPGERERAAERLSPLGVTPPFLLVHPGAHYPAQRYPRLAEAAVLAARAGASVLAVAAPAERDLLGPFAAAGLPTLETPDLRLFMALAASAALFLGNNSGPLHIAAALGTPTVSTLGPTRPAHFAPHGPGHVALRLGLPCSPCERADCPGHACLRGIPPAELAAAALGRLARAGAPPDDTM